MTKRETIEEMLIAEGFTLRYEIKSYKGPKVKSDILECWHADTRETKTLKLASIYNAHTMTELCKTGLKVIPNYPASCLYGDYLVVPK